MARNLCPTASEHMRRFAQIFDPPIGARADKDPIHCHTLKLVTGLEPHILERITNSLAFGGRHLMRRRHCGRYRQRLLWTGAPGHCRRNLRGIHQRLTVKLSIFITGKHTPVRTGLFPCPSLRSKGAVFDIGQSCLVWRYDPKSCAALNRHVAQRHPAFHGQPSDGGACVFHSMALRPIGSQLADPAKGDILSRDAETQGAFDPDAHGFWFALPYGLRGQHMGHFCCANAKGQRTKGTVG